MTLIIVRGFLRPVVIDVPERDVMLDAVCGSGGMFVLAGDYGMAQMYVLGGVDAGDVGTIFGHANAAMTLNVCAGTDAKAEQAAATTIDEVMERRPAAGDGSFV